MARRKKRVWNDGIERTAPPSARLGDHVGIAWYDPLTFKLFKSVECDVAPDTDDWEAWFKTYQIATRAAVADGLVPQKVPVKARALLEWLQARGLENNRQNRIQYIAWLLEQRSDSSSA